MATNGDGNGAGSILRVRQNRVRGKWGSYRASMLRPECEKPRKKDIALKDEKVSVLECFYSLNFVCYSDGQAHAQALTSLFFFPQSLFGGTARGGSDTNDFLKTCCSLSIWNLFCSLLVTDGRREVCRLCRKHVTKRV